MIIFKEDKYDIDQIIIGKSHCKIKGKEINSNVIEIRNDNNNINFCFWTIVNYLDFNKLEVGKKTSIIKMIDDYDIDLSIGSDTSVNSRENCNIYFTKKEDNVFLLEAVICDKDFSVETIICFDKEEEK